MAKIKLTIGDKVQVYRKVTKEKDWYNVWLSDMDKSIGCCYKVHGISLSGVSLHGTPYDFPTSSLKHVK